MYKIAVLGDRDSIYGFAALGLSVFPAEDGAQGARMFRRLSEQEGEDRYAVIYITEALAAEPFRGNRKMPRPQISGGDPNSGHFGKYGSRHAGRKKERRAGSGI